MADAIAAARDEINAGRERIHEMHDRGLDGLQVCNRLTTLVDGVIGKLFDAAAAAEGDAAGARTKLALVALGGYGRRQSAPYSDVDLMLLHSGVEPELLSPLVRRFTNSVFDAGLQLGSSLRSAEEAITLARTDGVICSSLIDNRLIAGSQPLHEHFRELFDRMVRKRSKAVCKSFCDARAEERNQYGESLYLLEPHVKRSRGGLARHPLAPLDRLCGTWRIRPRAAVHAGGDVEVRPPSPAERPSLPAAAAERNALPRQLGQRPARSSRATSHRRADGLPRRRRACCRSSSSCATTSATPTTSGRWPGGARRRTLPVPR